MSHYDKFGGYVLLKAIVLSGFMVTTAVVVQTGYDALLVSVDSYVGSGYGVLAESDDLGLQKDSADITRRYRDIRVNY